MQPRGTIRDHGVTATEEAAEYLDCDIAAVITTDAKLCSELLEGSDCANPIVRMQKPSQRWLISFRRHWKKRASTMELGPLSDIASEPGVTDIAVTCDGTVWVDRGQGMRPYAMRAPFANPQAIRDFAVRLCSQLGRRLDDACPIADASTVEGVRVHAVIAPLVPQGAAISIRLPDAVAPSLESLAKNGMFPSKWMPLLEGFVERKASVLVTGGTGAGKTTLLKAMLMRCAPGERIITVEEVRELGMLDHDNRVSLVTRDANMEGKGAIGLSQLICATLRMRPDRIVVGECRGSEIVDLLRALNSGHRGGMTTLHANQVASGPFATGGIGVACRAESAGHRSACARRIRRGVARGSDGRPSAHHTNRATRICGRQTAWKPAVRMERQPDAGLAAVARFRTCMESLNRGGWMRSLGVIAAILFGLAVWLWPRRNTYDVGERTRDGSGCAGGRWSKEHGGKQGIETRRNRRLECVVERIARHRMCGMCSVPAGIRAQRSHVGAGIRRTGRNAVRHA